MTEDMEAVIERLEKYLSERAKSPTLDANDIHGLHVGDEREAILTVADLRALLSERRKMVEALAMISASAPAEKPEGPDYDCGNSGDIAWGAQQLAEWRLAQIARDALTRSKEHG